MDTDRNLLFGVLALQADLIDSGQFVEACTLWCTRKDVPLADVLAGRGWITPDDRIHVEYLLERKLRKHGGDARAGLANVPGDIKRSLAAVGDADIQQSLVALPGPAQTMPAATVDHVPAGGPRYSLKRLHATGGIGRVWLARDAQLGRDVALKELRPERAASTALCERFLKEARITGQLEHPGIVPVYELARRPDDQQPFYTMRFVKGRTLTEAASAFHEKRLAGRHEPLDLLRLLNAFVAVCNAVAYAHSPGVIHRDLKGQNVILGDFGEVVVLDWGLAKLVDCPGDVETMPAVVDAGAPGQSDHTVQGQMVGTPAYMAPEQAAGRPDLIGRRTDVYGLGAVLYEILTGRPPFTGTDTHEVLRKVSEEEPVPPRQLWPEVPPALEVLCLTALAKQPADRPTAASALAQEVQGWQEFERRKAEEALRESEELYHSLVETIPVSVWRKDLQGAYTFVNQRVCEVLGKLREEIIGKTDTDLYPGEAANNYRRDDALVLATGGPFETTQEFVGPHGKRYVQVIKTALHDAHGNMVGTQGIAWDITERKLAEEERRKAEQALRESEALYHSLVECLPCNVFRKDLEGRFTFANHRFCELVGLPLEQLLGRTSFDINRPELAEKYRRDDQRVIETGAVVEDSEEYLGESERYVHILKTAVRDAAGQVIGVQGISWDVTARKLAEEERRKAQEALRQSEALYQSLVETIPLSVWRKDLQGRFIFANKRFCDSLGKPLEEVIGRTDYHFFPPELAAKYRADDTRVHETGTIIETTEDHRTAPGEKLYVRVVKAPVFDAHGEAIGTQGIFWDLTQWKRTEEELRRSLQRFELAVQGSQDGLWDRNLTTDEIYYSPRYKAMLGYTEREFSNRPEEWAKRVHPDDIDRVRGELRTHFKGRESLSWLEYRMRHKDGSYRWIRSRVFVLRDPTSNRVYRMAGSNEDITDRKNAEDELAQERYLFHTLMDNQPDAIFFMDTAHRFIRANKFLTDLVGLDNPGRLISKTYFDFMTEEVARQAIEADQEIIRTGCPSIAKERPITFHDGRMIWVSTTKVPFRDRNGNIIGVLGISRDITQRKQADLALRQSEERYRSVIAAMQAGILILDAQAGILDCNASAERILGLSAEQLMGRTPQDPRWKSIHEDGTPFPGDTFPSMVTLRTGQPCFDVIMGVHKPDGALTWISINSQPLFRPGDDRPHAVVASIEDITARRRTEEALRETAAELARCRQGLERLRAERSDRECEGLR
jgi:PAS domain S-box-containing protein